MKLLLFCIVALPFNILVAAPPRSIPEDLLDEYTMNGQISVEPWYIDGTYSDVKKYSKQEITSMMERVSQRETNYYGKTDTLLYEAIEDHLESIQGKEVAIMGSAKPWYESILLYYGANPTTIEYNRIETDDDRINIMTVAEYEKNPKLFDAVVSISSYEHDGLGRYGDPLNPIGDFQAMEKTKRMLKEGGLLFLAIPVGEKDRMFFNAHRVYGPIRLPLMLDGWDVVGRYGVDERLRCTAKQPVFVLAPEKEK